MKVLVITGDKNFKPGAERYELQKSAVEALEVIYWGRGNTWPKIPAGHFDVVTVQDPLLRGVFGLYVAKKIGARLNVQVHMDLGVLPLWKHVLAKIILSHADTIRVVSNKIKSQAGHVGVNTKIFIVPVYVDISKFKNVVRRGHDGKNILWVGRFEEEKNPLQAIEVLKEVLKVEPAAKLIMLGKGSLSQQVTQKAANLPIELPGWQDPILFLETADVVLSTSLHESWGASIVEALAAGVAVVAPDVGIAKEAGANVVDRKDLAKEVTRVLQSGQKGELKLPMLTKTQWATAWKETLQ